MSNNHNNHQKIESEKQIDFYENERYERGKPTPSREERFGAPSRMLLFSSEEKNPSVYRGKTLLLEYKVHKRLQWTEYFPPEEEKMLSVLIVIFFPPKGEFESSNLTFTPYAEYPPQTK